MENIVNLEQLDYRDRLIKDYIDNHSAGGSSDYMDITVAIKRVYENNKDVQHAYVGVPEGTDMTGLSLKFLRHSKVCIRNNNRKQLINWDTEKYNGYHEIWSIPTKNKIPLINIVFKDSTTVDFTKGGYDFYEITGQIGETIYDTLLSYVNTTEETGYYSSLDSITRNPVSYGEMLSHKKGGVCIIKDGQKLSNVAHFESVYNINMGVYRLTTTK